jgi:ABC-type antimicrobial peptide transport system permease subunit
VSLGAALGFVSVALSTAGLYALMAYTVRRRTREIGIRLAIGATTAQVVRPVLWQGFSLVAIGVGIGLGIAAAVTRALRAGLAGLSPLDPIAVGSVIGVFLVAALVAALLPARRAAAVDPIAALRDE